MTAVGKLEAVAQQLSLIEPLMMIYDVIGDCNALCLLYWPWSSALEALQEKVQTFPFT